MCQVSGCSLSVSRRKFEPVIGEKVELQVVKGGQESSDV